MEPSCCGVTAEDFMEWTVAILLGVVIITGMSGNSLLDGVVVAAKVPTAVEDNALLLLLLLLTAALDGEDRWEAPTGIKARIKANGNFKLKKKTSKKRPTLLIRIALKKLKNIFNYLPLVRAEKRISDDQIWNEKPYWRGLWRCLVVEFVIATLRQLGIFISLSK